jgi:predicted DNA-binding protein (MmcQ/YjbR family)
MDIDAIRGFCLSFPQTKEQLQWGDSLLMKVAGRMFAIVNLSVESPARLALRCTPEKYAELVEREGITPSRYNMWKYHWVSLERLDTLGNEELKDLLRQSYELIAAKAIKKKRSSSRRLAITGTREPKRRTPRSRRVGKGKSPRSPGAK